MSVQGRGRVVGELLWCTPGGLQRAGKQPGSRCCVVATAKHNLSAPMPGPAPQTNGPAVPATVVGSRVAGSLRVFPATPLAERTGVGFLQLADLSVQGGKHARILAGEKLELRLVGRHHARRQRGSRSGRGWGWGWWWCCCCRRCGGASAGGHIRCCCANGVARLPQQLCQGWRRRQATRRSVWRHVATGLHRANLLLFFLTRCAADAVASRHVNRNQIYARSFMRNLVLQKMLTRLQGLR